MYSLQIGIKNIDNSFFGYIGIGDEVIKCIWKYFEVC